MEVLNQVMEFLKGLESGPLFLMLTMGVEVAMRAMKTEKPRSILYVASDVMKRVSEILCKLSEVLDKLLQRTK